MKNEALNSTIVPTCVGNGLVALDVIIGFEGNNQAQFLAGGSCGNVMTILSYLGWNSYPIARLSNNVAGDLLFQDLQKWNVKDDLLQITETGSTPVIIHRILKDKKGDPKHRFEFRNPEDGKYLPSYKPCLAKSVPTIIETVPHSNVFYFDRINRASIDLAKAYKATGTTIFFEPSSVKDQKGFQQSLELADVLKFAQDRIPEYDLLYPVASVPLEIQTLGSLGLKYRKKGEKSWTKLAGYSIENVIDSAGAGDWLTSGIIMNLFKNKGSNLSELSTDKIEFALHFGQALSAMNCTFEGARGLMYEVPRQELILMISHIVSSSKHIINLGNRVKTFSHNDLGVRKISSLFATAHR
ncbi:carbohydrate kinase [Pedobacter aquae]|uniref:Carbohydrate kinase n=1 Tax=Pedobacter aquae TaxID=2605747 RepID=A0A5C0VHH9_9SPHI|nr:carbohydrate kinase [Pedobacter aquae]QEK50680.1 carbohydrate kinase [Pedobacter aquae]